MTTHLFLLNKKTFTASLLLVLVAGLLPFRASAADFASTAPAATVARGQREVLTMNFSVPAYSGDLVADADGANSEDVGVASVQAGGILHNISSAARLAYGAGGQSDPKSIWIDRDGSKKYTPNYGADTTVIQNDALGIPLPEGDVGATLKKSGMGSLKMLFSDPANPNVWHSAADALYLDTGTVSGLVDSADVRVGTNGRFKQGSLAVAGKAAIIARGSGVTCPAGIAAEDLIRIVGKSNIGVKEVIYDHTASGACIATLVLYTINYPYAIDDQFEIVSPYLLDLDIMDIKDAGDNGAPDAQTTSLQITAGTAKGIAVGDTLRIARGGATISYKVIELSSLAKIIKVQFASGGLVGGIGEPYAASITSHAPWSGILTGMLESLPNFIGYADDNASLTRDSDEPIYADVDGSNKVSKNDVRITNVRAEKRLLKKDGAVDALGGTYVDTATMGNPKWYSQTNPWVEGSDIVIDKDNDGFFNLDLLNTLKLKNEGTAAAAAITGVDLWMEDNGVAGFQGTFSAGGSTDVHIGTLTYNAGTNLWTGAALNQPLIAAEQFYVTANVASNAVDAATLRFAVIPNGLATTHRTMPDALVTNNAAQTISAAAVIPPEQQPPVALPSAEFSHVRVIGNAQVVANGQDTTTIEVEVRDSNNQAMQNKTVTLERLRGAENIVLETKQDSTNALGITRFTISGNEAGIFRFRAKVGSLFVGNTTITFTAIPDGNPSGLVEGDLFMTAGAAPGATVYYFAHGKKYPFPNERVYLSWFADFNSVTIKRISAQAMGDLPWGTNVRYRPGTRMIKVPDDPKVYAITPGGTVCWVKDEATATKFYGPTWNKKIDDLLASLFVGTYHNNPFCDFTVDSRYGTGTIVSTGGKPFYIDEGTRRAISDDAWTGNRFRNEFLITVNNLDAYPAGQPVGETEFAKLVD